MQSLRIEFIKSELNENRQFANIDDNLFNNIKYYLIYEYY